MLNDKKYIGMDVHKESISIAVRNDAGKIVMECVIETKASVILQFIDGLRGDLQVTYRDLGSTTGWESSLIADRAQKQVCLNCANSMLNLTNELRSLEPAKMLSLR